MDQGAGLLFVYGTLKRGHANHHQLGGAAFVGEAAMPGVDLHDLGPFPMAVAGEGTAIGELYRVDAGQLVLLDRFEGVPRLYRRERRVLDDGRPVWVYLGTSRQVRHSPRLAAGIWPGSSGSDAAPARPPRAAGRDSMTSLSRPCATALPGGGGLAVIALLCGPLLQAVAPSPARAEASWAQCQRWQRSSGPDWIQQGNAIGAAAYLTKVQRLAESDPGHPRLLYAPSDLKRACAAWR